MAPPNNPDVARITWQMHRGIRTFENTFHLYRTGGWTSAQLQASVDAADNLWTTSYKVALPSGIGLFNTHGVVYDPDGSPWVADHPESPEVFGSIGGNMEAGNVTVTISERANLAGRAYRGRIYVPSISEGYVTQDDTITSTLISLLSNFGIAWLSTFNAPTGVGQLVIFHRNDNLFSTVRSLIIENIVDSQRRRLPGRGI